MLESSEVSKSKVVSLPAKEERKREGGKAT